MKYSLFLLLFLLSCEKNNFQNLTDKEIAIKLAETKWKEVYENSEIDKQKPFTALKINDSIWIVQGTYPEATIGGTAHAEVNVKSKIIVSYTHGE